MAIQKVMGIETEYGITVRNQADFNPILSSLHHNNSYETYRTARIRWDYEAESPLRDARGFDFMEGVSDVQRQNVAQGFLAGRFLPQPQTTAV